MAVITGLIADSAGRVESGRIDFVQAQRIDTGEMLVTQSVATAQVVAGQLRSLDGSQFELPANPEGSAVRIREILGGRTFEWWAAVPDVAQVEYRELPVVESASAPTSVFAAPPWIAEASAARDQIVQAVTDGAAIADALGGVAGLQTLADNAASAANGAEDAASNAAGSAAAAEAAAATINAPAIEARFVSVENEVEELSGSIVDLTEELAVDSSTPVALQLESYVSENLLGAQRAPGHIWYGHEVNPKWKSAVTAVKAGTASAKVLCIGDSTTYGTAASMPEGWMGQNSWPSVMAKYLDRHVVPAERGLAIPPSDGSSVPERTVDSRWTLGADWSRATTAGLGLGGKNSVYMGVPGSTYLDFKDPYIVADRFDIYYLRISTSTWGTFRAVVGGGGTPVDVNTAGAASSSVEMVTITAPTRAANQLMRIRNSGASGNVYIIGVEAWDSTRRHVRVANAGSSGSTSSGWLTPHSSFADAWNVFGFLKAYKPDLTIIDLGINDANPDSPLAVATFLANVKRIADAAAAEGSAVLFKTMIPSGGDRNTREAQYVAALKGLSPRRAILDLFTHYSYERNYDRGWMNDSAHGNDSMYADVGNVVSEFLLRYSGN